MFARKGKIPFNWTELLAQIVAEVIIALIDELTKEKKEDK